MAAVILFNMNRSLEGEFERARERIRTAIEQAEEDYARDVETTGWAMRASDAYAEGLGFEVRP